jgi:hypothetical protein
MSYPQAWLSTGAGKHTFALSLYIMTDRIKGMSNTPDDDINDINEIIGHMEFFEFGNPDMLSLETMRKLIDALYAPQTPDPEWN